MGEIGEKRNFFYHIGSLNAKSSCVCSLLLSVTLIYSLVGLFSMVITVRNKFYTSEKFIIFSEISLPFFSLS